MSALTYFRCWLIEKFAGSDIQVMCNITIRNGCWYVAEKELGLSNVAFTENRIFFETPEIQAEFLAAFPEALSGSKERV
jgi:hypothetical protein